MISVHQHGHLDVELDKEGKVVAVWYRCSPLPFQQVTVDDKRAKEMREFYMEKRGIFKIDVGELPCPIDGSSESSDLPSPHVPSVTGQGD